MSPWAPLGCEFLRFFPIFDDLDSFLIRYYKVCLQRLSNPQLGCSDVFLMFQLAEYTIGRKPKEAKCCSSHHNKGYMLSPWILPVVAVFARFLLSISPLPHCGLWKEITTYGPHLRSGEMCSNSLRADYLHKLFRVLLHEGSVSSPFIYSIIILHQCWVIYFYFIFKVTVKYYFILWLKMFQGFLWELFL